MSVRIKRNWDWLKVIKQATPTQRKAILATASDDLILAICEIADNVLDGPIKLSPKQKSSLNKYKNALRDTADKKVSKTKKKNILIQKGGFLPIVLGPALSLIASFIGEELGKRI